MASKMGTLEKYEGSIWLSAGWKMLSARQPCSLIIHDPHGGSWHDLWWSLRSSDAATWYWYFEVAVGERRYDILVAVHPNWHWPSEQINRHYQFFGVILNYILASFTGNTWAALPTSSFQYGFEDHLYSASISTAFDVSHTWYIGSFAIDFSVIWSFLSTGSRWSNNSHPG